VYNNNEAAVITIMKNPALFVPVRKLNIKDQSLRHYVERLQQLALHDPLTNLPNRVLFMDRLLTAIRKAKRSGLKLALLYFDLDQFKRINDVYGHGVGDKVLKHAAHILQTSIRESDTSARLGGDEFIILLEGLTDMRVAENIAQAILEKIKKPFTADHRILNTSASIGLAAYPQDAMDHSLIKCADQALNRAKEAGKDKYEWFSKA
jgi:diguanylate cyclase (GGDEF)-like protein